MTDYVFFLGGRDLEMETIRALVAEAVGAEALRDRGLDWGARLSDYAAELAELPPGAVPVLVELALDIPPPPGAIVVDHHGLARTNHQTSLEQVFYLLGLQPQRWTRALAMVAANDRGHVRALRAMGATDEEIAFIRRADRRAQGITAEEEAAGETAVAACETHLDGAVTVVRLPHARTAVVTDRLTASNLLVVSPAEVNFFGTGRAVSALDHAFPGGWSGGDLPDAGFWGIAAPPPDEASILAILSSVAQP